MTIETKSDWILNRDVIREIIDNDLILVLHFLKKVQFLKEILQDAFLQSHYKKMGIYVCLHESHKMQKNTKKQSVK